MVVDRIRLDIEYRRNCPAPGAVAQNDVIVIVIVIGIVSVVVVERTHPRPRPDTSQPTRGLSRVECG